MEIKLDSEVNLVDTHLIHLIKHFLSVAVGVSAEKHLSKEVLDRHQEPLFVKVRVYKHVPDIVDMVQQLQKYVQVAG